MKFTIFGLSISSAWGNGHATLWRGLCKALARRGHTIVFYERDVPYYASTRDLVELANGFRLVLYNDWNDVRSDAQRNVDNCDAAIITSYCPDALVATALVLESRAGSKVFYDLDSPVTLARLAAGEEVAWVGPGGYRDFNLVLSYAGGRTLDELRHTLHARRVVALYGSVDPEVHKPATSASHPEAAISYMGTWSADRDVALNALFVEPARRMPEKRFLIAGAMYDGSFPWLANIYFGHHVPPAEHAAFYSSAPLTLNVTRAPMAELGWCPSGRLFEASACGTAVLSDNWDGLDSFYVPGSEILVANTTDDAIAALELSPEELTRIGRRARERTLDCHTAENRAIELEEALVPEAIGACGA